MSFSGYEPNAAPEAVDLPLPPDPEESSWLTEEARLAAEEPVDTGFLDDLGASPLRTESSHQVEQTPDRQSQNAEFAAQPGAEADNREAELDAGGTNCRADSRSHDQKAWLGTEANDRRRGEAAAGQNAGKRRLCIATNKGMEVLVRRPSEELGRSSDERL